MGGSVAHDAVAEAPGRPWSFSDIPCSHGQKKGKDWMERCTAETCFLTLDQQTGKTPYLLQSPLLEAGLYLYNTRFTKVDAVPYPRHFLPLTHISPFWRGYVSNDTQKQAHSFPLLLYHLLSTCTLSFWTIFFGVPSPILR